MTINAAAVQGNLEMVKYCVANECPIDETACAYAAENGHLEVLKYLREEVKAPWDSDTASYAASNGHLHILEYLVEREYDNYDVWRVSCSRERPLGLFEVLARNRQSAVGLWAVRERTRKINPNVYNTSSTTTVLSHAVGDTSTASYSFTDQSKKNQSNIYNTQTHTHTHMYSS